MRINKPSCVSTLHYGDNDLASLNKQMPNKSKNKQPGGVVLYGLPPKPMGEAKMKMIFTIDIYGQLKVKFYSLDNGHDDYYNVDINGLLTEVKSDDENNETTNN